MRRRYRLAILSKSSAHKMHEKSGLTGPLFF
nr:MAG TPA: ATP synthase B chain-like protein [Caudoviricetes sp.]